MFPGKCFLNTVLLVFCIALPVRGGPTAEELLVQMRPLYTTFGDPSDYLVGAGGVFDGVADLIVQRSDGTFRCSGSLLASGQDVLTAAHCLTDGDGTPNASRITATFATPNGNVVRESSEFVVHDQWNGEFFTGFDVALIDLGARLPIAVPRLPIYRDVNEVGRTVNKAGYGRSGNGDDGDVLISGTKRSGRNRYDALGDVFDSVAGIDPEPGAQLAYDFDNGTTANDAFGFFDTALGAGNLADLGLGADEVLSAPGDSGGPTLLDGSIAGVTSYGLRLRLTSGDSSDVDAELNSTFGEFAVDTRVSFFADWVDTHLGPLPGDMDCDGDADFDDVDEFILALNYPGTYTALFGADAILKGDVEGDGDLDFDDVDDFASLVTSSAAAATGIYGVPEPSAGWLVAEACATGLVFAIAGFRPAFGRRRRRPR